MTSEIGKRVTKSGMAGGTLLQSRDKKLSISASLLRYDQESFDERDKIDLSEIQSISDSNGVTWLDVNGVSDPKFLEELGKIFNIHSLVLEDISDTSERPKVDDYDSYIYVVLKMVWPDSSDEFRYEQVSFIVTHKLLISFQETDRDVFDPVRERIRSGKGKTRRHGADFLMYSLLDAIVDRYYEVLEHLGERLEDLEDLLIEDPTQGTIQAIHNFKRQVLLIRRFVWPLRDMLAMLSRLESPIIDDSTRLYIRDVYDHSVELIDIIENSREVVSGLIDIYLSSQSNRLNEVMKILTIIATIFMPLSWITGIFGMNFILMPGLSTPWGFWACVLVMLVIASCMLYYFKRRKWI